MSAVAPRIYFYPQSYLRDRPLDTVRHWPAQQVVNPEMLEGRTGAQVTRSRALGGKLSLSWKQRIPLVNVKFRPRNLGRDVVMYIWGGISSTGPFITDLESPWALTG